MEINMTGKFATSKAGHDRDKLYVIVSCDEKYVFLVDGKSKTMASPKKKSLKHIQIINETVEQELLEQIMKQKPHIDDAIKYAIKCKMNSLGVEERNV